MFVSFRAKKLFELHRYGVKKLQQVISFILGCLIKKVKFCSVAHNF